MGRRVVVAVLLGLSLAQAGAAPLKEIMVSRYLRYQSCMEKAFGPSYANRLGIETRVNQWGVLEPTFASITKQPDSIRRVDENCRKQSEIESEARPDF